MSERTRITLRDLLRNPYTRLGIELASVVLGFWLLAELSGVLTPVLVGLLLAYMVDPLVSWMHRRGFSRAFSVTVVFGGTALLLLLTLLLGLPKAWHEGRIFYHAAMRGDVFRDADGDGRWQSGEVLLRDLNGNGRYDPSYLSRAYDTMRHQGLLDETAPSTSAAHLAVGVPVEPEDPFDLELWAKNRLQILVGTVQDGDRTVVNRTLAVLVSTGWWTIAILLIPVYGYFFSLNLPAVSRVIVNHIPPPHRDRTLRILSEINAVVGAFFRGRVTICAICAVISMVGFGVSGVPSWAVLGVIGLSARDLFTRRLPREVGSPQIAAWAFCTLVPLGLAMLAQSGGAVWPAPVALAQMGGALAIGVLAYLALIGATRLGEISVVTPFRYSRMIFALAIGMAVLLPFLGFLVNGALALWRPDAKRIVSMVGPAVLVGSFVIAILVFLEVRSAPHAGPILVHYWDWMTVGTLELALQFQVDQLSVVMMLVITGIGSLIHIFSVGYMRADPGYARYFSYLNLFVAFMLILVLGSNLPVLFIGWEGVGLCSYLLIGFWYQDKANADAGKKAFIVNRIGDFGVLVAMFTLWWSLGTLEFSEIAELAPTGLVVGGGIVTLITMALFVGCTGKSAQIPLYTWLPDAMAGPTPVSALIHAATMVTAGVYLVARTSVLFAMAPTTSMVVAGIGALTAVFAATIGLRQYDIKKVLAYSTVSQLGYMFLAVGTGAYVAGVFHLVTHAFFKALLFLGSGSVIHAMHHALHATHSPADPQDMRNMGGLKRYLPWTYGLMMIATLAIAGIPIFSGFFSKDEILAFAFSRAAEAPIWYLFWGMGLAAALMTAF